ncbi:MAG: FAD-dependent oxidoreductase [Actinomycetes bacterium]
MAKKYKVAIVGAGPSGYFAAQALQNSATEDLTFSIDMIERLPTPWGLVRSGVAPDHPKIKTVAKVFEKIASEPGFRLFGNIELGKDISLEDLTNRYDAVIMATGSAIGKKLGIPGEDLPNSISAAQFVPWYNGHPDYADFKVDLSGKVAVVIGAGNVAMDCGRILAIDPKELDETDTADHAHQSLHESNIRKVFISGRRGAEFAAFTAPELRDLPKLEHTDVYINEEAIALAHKNAEAKGEIEKHLASNLEAMKSIAETPKHGHPRSLEFLFSHTPKEIIGSDKVEAIVYSTPSGDVTISCDLVITAIGYEATAIPGITYGAGKIVNVDGRVSGSNIYTVGWAKRGPSGVIGTNKSDSTEVVKLLISDLKDAKVTGDIEELLTTNHKIVDQTYWVRINTAELAAGEARGKPRVKAVSVADLLRLGQP